MAETLVTSVVGHPSVVVRSVLQPGQTVNMPEQQTQGVPRRWGVLSHLVVGLAGKQKQGRCRPHIGLDNHLAHVGPHNQTEGSPGSRAAAAHKERPCEVAG